MYDDYRVHRQDRDGTIAELEDGSVTTGELVQRHFAGASVVKAFNNIWFGHLGSLGRPSGAADRSALPIAGDDATARKTVTDFLDTIGYDTVDLGPLVENRRTQRDTPVYVTPYGVYGETGTPVDAASIRKFTAAV
ncbi:NADPH-dependent F420 reductase [Actinoplanes derwentensis]|uniref:NADPH-dependent F420 reductase n=1 Tax=Actinoplanes derwentensis TaxID=113562 RepID=UPI0018D37BFA|nr:hypothetical protein [Actinoplanes derwentensis]